MKEIQYKVIPHSEMRYNTCGDYWLDDNGVYQIRVSQMSDWRYCFLVFIHEIFELAWVIWKGIDIKEIDAFDIEYEKNRKEGDESEPGDDPSAPYYSGHQMATLIERSTAWFLEVDWKKYDEEIINL